MTASDDFTSVTREFRPELLVHCYRMLGSADEAEDLVQETYLRAWRGYAAFQGRSSVRTWLYRIATNACLTAIERRGRRPLPSGSARPVRTPGRRSRGARTSPGSSPCRERGWGSHPMIPRRWRRPGPALGWHWSPPGSTCPPGSARS